jgi:hypothetical protein
MRRWMLAGGAVAAGQMALFVSVASVMRPGYDPSRNWISQLSLGPGGWQGTVNLATCGLWLLVCAAGLRGRLASTGAARWAVRLVGWCGTCLVAVAVVPTDPGIGYPPGVPSVYTATGAVHQLVALTMGVAGIVGAVLLGRCLREAWALPAGVLVAAVMTVSLVSGSVLVLLDAGGVLPGAPSGLLERVALFAGLGWTGVVSTALLVRSG